MKNCNGNCQQQQLDMDDLRIPEWILSGESLQEECRIPKWPMLVFINTRSGGQLGTALLETFNKLLAPYQVFDLNQVDPAQVLSKILSNLSSLQAQGNKAATEVRDRLRLVVAGGDGTAGWLLGIASDLSPDHPIPIATIPLGTGNNLPFSFGWGKRNPGVDAASTIKFLKQVVDAHPVKVDRWQVVTKMPWVEPEQLPYALHPVEATQGNTRTYVGAFWNYFSIGMDAQVSYEFHARRKEHPERFNNQLRNQCAYAKLGCTQGWFCASCMCRVSRSLNEIATVYVAEPVGAWKKLQIPSSIRSLVLLNLPSFSGGLDPWGSPSDKKSVKRGLTQTSVQDGRLEVVGFRDAWHGTFLLLPKGHGTRLAQVHRVKIEFRPVEAGSYTYLRMDGEPWRQALPQSDDEGTTSIEITRHGQGVMLAKDGCIAEHKDDFKYSISISKRGIEPKVTPKRPQSA